MYFVRHRPNLKHLKTNTINGQVIMNVCQVSKFRQLDLTPLERRFFESSKPNNNWSNKQNISAILGIISLNLVSLLCQKHVPVYCLWVFWPLLARFFEKNLGSQIFENRHPWPSYPRLSLSNAKGLEVTVSGNC